MRFEGISREFSLVGEGQYDTIGAFWDELEAIYGLENLCGLGYRWDGDTIFYAIGLKDGCIDGCNFSIDLPDGGWTTVRGQTDDLKQMYDEIYKFGRLKFEIETFFDDGSCEIKYCR